MADSITPLGHRLKYFFSLDRLLGPRRYAATSAVGENFGPVSVSARGNLIQLSAFGDNVIHIDARGARDLARKLDQAADAIEGAVATGGD